MLFSWLFKRKKTVSAESHNPIKNPGLTTVLIVYGSTSGNTICLTSVVEQIVRDARVVLDSRNVVETSPEDLKKYDVIILGASTWTGGELQEDFKSFYDALKTISLEGKHGALYGVGDSSYPHFCKAVDLLRDCLKEAKCTIIIDSLKIDGKVEEHFEEAQEWARDLVQRIYRLEN